MRIHRSASNTVGGILAIEQEQLEQNRMLPLDEEVDEDWPVATPASGACHTTEFGVRVGDTERPPASIQLSPIRSVIPTVIQLAHSPSKLRP
jgi:hypothetical protein